MPGSLLLLFIASAPAQEIVERGGTGRGRTVRRMDAPTEPTAIVAPAPQTATEPAPWEPTPDESAAIAEREKKEAASAQQKPRAERAPMNLE